MSLIDEAQNNVYMEKELEKGMAAEPVRESFEEDFDQDGGGFGFSLPDLGILKAKTGAGSIDEYVHHPLNIHESKAAARIIRGCTGILGESDLALVDILIGAIELHKEKGSHVEGMQ